MQEGKPEPVPRMDVEYWVRSASASGRLRLKIRLFFKLGAWRLVLFLSHGLKRLLDIVVSGVALLVLSPFLAIVAWRIRRFDGGPVFFRQMRVGRRGKLFPMWKFRSMVLNAEEVKAELMAKNEMQDGVTFKMKDDPRITPIGRFIRKYSVDELPQFWNVFCGQMSLVGPRPPVPAEVEMYSPEDRQRLLVKPGLTCFWQVGGRSDIDFSGQVRLDIDYIRSTSVWTDLKLLFLTIPAVLLGKGAY
jgi:lipopolysaccharide/colanic/teichoic acid biosynthesis glycosyltransferase